MKVNIVVVVSVFDDMSLAWYLNALPPGPTHHIFFKGALCLKGLKSYGHTFRQNLLKLYFCIFFSNSNFNKLSCPPLSCPAVARLLCDSRADGAVLVPPEDPLPARSLRGGERVSGRRRHHGGGGPTGGPRPRIQ